MSNLVIFIPNDKKNGENENIEIFKLIHPAYGTPNLFCIKNNELYELKQLSKENERSWFFENNVKEEGSFYCICPFDPLFIFINIFDNMDKKDFFQQLDIILYNEDIPCYSYLNQVNNIEEKLKNICDVNDLNINTNEMVFKYNETKALEWLKRKIDNLCKNFENLTLCMNLLNKYETSNEDIEIKKKRIAIILMSEYLSVKWSIKLKKSLNLPEPVENETNYVYANEEDLIYNSRNSNKRAISTETLNNTKKKKATLTPGQQRLAKANKSGMRSLESFFKKK
ncbi:hypothetical protein BCR36DRAFT_411218 [Piromyces finnis]|uniref:Ribonuclease H2 subunit B n=1 Tax=Piromyces finnis TaxID=1754191 RepID=A0A1Y1VEN9_9FUNG|nr:hypothetical protein BCR36DRAFT_411218 [Piromyces finnis]|eukprot:ORX53446.1 hypothetical protein BCR36DRAFT_411218 [Piromyces finnis]